MRQSESRLRKQRIFKMYEDEVKRSRYAWAFLVSYIGISVPLKRISALLTHIFCVITQKRMKKLILLSVFLFTVLVNNASGQTVYITNTGTKYHRAGCQYLSRSCHAIDLKDAIAEGYAPCKVCCPPTTISRNKKPLYSKQKKKVIDSVKSTTTR